MMSQSLDQTLTKYNKSEMEIILRLLYVHTVHIYISKTFDNFGLWRTNTCKKAMLRHVQLFFSLKGN